MISLSAGLPSWPSPTYRWFPCRPFPWTPETAERSNWSPKMVGYDRFHYCSLHCLSAEDHGIDGFWRCSFGGDVDQGGLKKTQNPNIRNRRLSNTHSIKTIVGPTPTLLFGVGISSFWVGLTGLNFRGFPGFGSEANSNQWNGTLFSCKSGIHGDEIPR